MFLGHGHLVKDFKELVKSGCLPAHYCKKSSVYLSFEAGMGRSGGVIYKGWSLAAGCLRAVFGPKIPDVSGYYR